jgi:hypothetical protein
MLLESLKSFSSLSICPKTYIYRESGEETYPFIKGCKGSTNYVVEYGYMYQEEAMGCRGMVQGYLCLYHYYYKYYLLHWNLNSFIHLIHTSCNDFYSRRRTYGELRYQTFLCSYCLFFTIILFMKSWMISPIMNLFIQP